MHHANNNKVAISKSEPRQIPILASRGFTLLELLVVLTIVGLISAVAVPQLSTLSARVEFALNREKLERALSLLPYQAYRRHQDLVLGVLPKPELGESVGLTSFKMDEKNPEKTITIEGPTLLSAATLPLPEGWSIDLPNPIIYRATGLCSGGELNVRVGSYVYTYKLSAPRCEPREQ